MAKRELKSTATRQHCRHLNDEKTKSKIKRTCLICSDSLADQYLLKILEQIKPDFKIKVILLYCWRIFPCHGRFFFLGISWNESQSQFYQRPWTRFQEYSSWSMYDSLSLVTVNLQTFMSLWPDLHVDVGEQIFRLFFCCLSEGRQTTCREIFLFKSFFVNSDDREINWLFV